MPVLERLSPFRELELLDRRMRRMFSDLPFVPAITPAADVYETDGELVVELEVPGYEEKELEIELSQIQSAQLLDYFLAEIAPSVYNGAIADAQTFMRDRLGDLEASCFQGEFTYWPKGSSVRRKR